MLALIVFSNHKSIVNRPNDLSNSLGGISAIKDSPSAVKSH